MHTAFVKRLKGVFRLNYTCLRLGQQRDQKFRWTWMDTVGFPQTPSDSIRQIGIGGYHRTTLCAVSDFHLTSGTFFASNVSYFPWQVLKIESCQFHRKTTLPIGVYWKCTSKSRYLPFFSSFLTTQVKEKQNRKLGKCNEIRNNRDMISGEVQKRDLKIIDKSCPSRQYKK